jgi:predicted alpha/beta-fold hydrolase
MISEKHNIFNPPWYLINNHFETIYPALFRKVEKKSHHTERIGTPDDDFIVVDYYDLNKNKTAILCHGLEGNSQKPYMQGMVNILIENDFNCIAWNFRGCSGVANNHAYSYHSGATTDLDLVIKEAIKKFPTSELFLIGFSLGGNLILKFLGEKTGNSPIKKAVAISTPLDLKGSCKKISKTSNWIYTKRFLFSLKRKIKVKAKTFPKEISLVNLNHIKNLEDFDDQYTAPLHGFSNANDYYTKCSSIHFLNKITVPTLIINALNDPFLSDNCYPKNINDNYITYDYPLNGGHLGFKMQHQSAGYYHEIKTIKFLSM